MKTIMDTNNAYSSFLEQGPNTKSMASDNFKYYNYYENSSQLEPTCNLSQTEK
jgi:hypothetical protein